MGKLLRKLAIKLFKKTVFFRLTDEPGWDGETKVDFEKDLVKILEKYNIYKVFQNTVLQSIEIKAGVEEFPFIKIETLIFDKPDELNVTSAKSKVQKC